LSSERWERIQTLFEQALERPDEVRGAFIASACGGDIALRDEVASLLAFRLRPGNRQPDQGEDQVQELPADWLRALGQSNPVRFITGQRIAGRYLVQRLLGSGGMGEVYEVWDEELAIPVALKTLRAISTEGALQRLKRESLLARSVSHPNVCRVYDVGRHGENGATVWFLTMELLRGETIAERLRREKTISPERALGYARQMAAGLDAAHQAGVVHRDFKTENVMLVGEVGEEQAVVMDFGISRATSPSEVLTRGAEIRGTAHFGTPAYMAPEQVRGETVGPLADIYALGVVLYEMVTGALPFTGRSAIEVARRRLKEPPPSPRSETSSWAGEPAFCTWSVTRLSRWPDTGSSVTSCRSDSCGWIGASCCPHEERNSSVMRALGSPILACSPMKGPSFKASEIPGVTSAGWRGPHGEKCITLPPTPTGGSPDTSHQEECHRSSRNWRS
jgi:serine/threonine protein kinase